MGEVYLAEDTQRGRKVALKLLPEVYGDDHEYLGRFKRESYVAARLREPHVIPIHDFGEIDDRLFIDMRLVVTPTTETTVAALPSSGAASPEPPVTASPAHRASRPAPPAPPAAVPPVPGRCRPRPPGRRPVSVVACSSR